MITGTGAARFPPKLRALRNAHRAVADATARLRDSAAGSSARTAARRAQERAQQALKAAHTAFWKGRCKRVPWGCVCACVYVYTRIHFLQRSRVQLHRRHGSTVPHAALQQCEPERWERARDTDRGCCWWHVHAVVTDTALMPCTLQENEGRVLAAVKRMPWVLNVSEVGILASNRSAALGVSPDFKAVVVDPVQLRALTCAIRTARDNGTALGLVPGLDVRMAADLDLSDASPLAVARFCGTMDRYDVAGEIKTVVGATTLPAARRRFSDGVALARDLDAGGGDGESVPWHYDHASTTFRCTFGDPLFHVVVPPEHQKQLAHAVLVTGSDASLYVVATTSGPLYMVLVTRGADPDDPGDFGIRSLFWASSADHREYGDRHGVENEFLAAHRDSMVEVVEYMGLEDLFTGIVGGSPGSLKPECPALKASVPAYLRLAFVTHWRLTMSVRLVALRDGPLPVCKRFKTYGRCPSPPPSLHVLTTPCDTLPSSFIQVLYNRTMVCSVRGGRCECVPRAFVLGTAPHSTRCVCAGAGSRGSGIQNSHAGTIRRDTPRVGSLGCREGAV